MMESSMRLERRLHVNRGLARLERTAVVAL